MRTRAPASAVPDTTGRTWLRTQSPLLALKLPPVTARLAIADEFWVSISKDKAGDRTLALPAASYVRTAT